jgi:hypothetical protein
MPEPQNSSGDHRDPPHDTITHLAYAEAAVMLIECLMVQLVERGVLSVDDLLETIETTLETKRVLEHEQHHPEISRVAAGVLSRMANSVAAGRPHSD